MPGGANRLRWERGGRLLCLGILGLGLGLLIVNGCRDPRKRHDMLTFFFDGVPPLDGQAEPNAAFAEADGTRRRPETVWTLHAPLQDCARCHGAQKQASFSREVKLVATVPALCYQCHPGPTTLTGWVHGPVVVGDCLLCHEPHRTVTPHLLRKPIPELCFQCHDPASIRAIANHELAPYQQCDACHAGHASPERHLLKSGPTVAALTTYRTAFEDARDRLRNGQSLEELLDMARALIGRDQLAQARAFLMGIKFHGTYTDEGRQTIEALIVQIDTTEQERLRREQALLYEQQRKVAERYYRGIEDYQAGQWERAREGFRAVQQSVLVPPAIAQAIRGYLTDIEDHLRQGRETNIPQEP